MKKMTIHKTAYDTLACNGMILAKTTDPLEKARLFGGLHYIGSNIYQVEGGDSSNDVVPSFAHPMLFPSSDSNHNDASLAIDVRSLGKFDPNHRVFVARLGSDLKLAQIRASLNKIWLDRPTTMLRDISPLPMMVFANWISEALGTKYYLEFEQRFKLNILAGVFYNSLFSNESTIDENEKHRLSAKISTSLRVQQGDVYEVVSKTPVIGNLTEFCKAAAEIADSVRLAELNPGIMMTILGYTWNGNATRELIYVALEHPPTWIAILLAAYTDRAYKMTPLTKIAERMARGDGGKQFSNAVQRLLELTPVEQ
jgi:hypothetical protein